jgi:hypothetical protein
MPHRTGGEHDPNVRPSRPFQSGCVDEVVHVFGAGRVFELAG